VRAAILTVAVCGLIAPGVAAERITQADLLQRLIDLDRLMLPPPPGEQTGLFSSFDRRQSTIRNDRYVHWAANNDRGQFIRTTTDGWNVMAEIERPGTITRIWCDEPAGDVRFMLDDNLVIEAPFADLFNGGLEPFGMPLSYQIPGGGGAMFCFPIGFARNCRILSRGFVGEYQIDYVTFAPQTAVERFQPELSREARKALEVVVQTFERGFSDRQLFPRRGTAAHAVQENIKPGAMLTWDVDGAGTIRAIYVSLTDENPPRQLYALHRLILRVRWDGRERPDIELPLTAFFGTGYERHLYNSLVMGTDLGTKMPGASVNEGWFMYCYFPMPFRDGAHIEIENLNPKPVTLGAMLYLRVERADPPANALRFKARMHTEDPCQTFDFPILKTRGSGRLVGCVLNVDCPREQWWGEGDHKIWIDDEQFPSILGTSTAGYFGNVKGLRPFRMPLHGATRVAPIGKSSVYRWHTADCVNFQKALRFTLENWQHEQADDVYYNAVVYWYGQPAADDSFESLSREALALHGIRIPGAVEIEDHIISENWGNRFKEKYAGGIELSGQAAAAVTTSEPIQVDIPWDRPGRYRLSLRVLTGRSFDVVEVRDADGNLIGTVRYDRASDGTYPVGDITLQPGTTRVSVRCTKSTVLDCWIVEPIGDSSP
jgi:hypothetical protein